MGERPYSEKYILSLAETDISFAYHVCYHPGLQLNLVDLLLQGTEITLVAK